MADPEGGVAQGSEEPTVIEAPAGSDGDSGVSDLSAATEMTPSSGTSAPSGITSSGTGITGLTGLPGSRSGATTASPMILQSEEHARTLALFRLVVLAGLACLIAIWLPERVSPGRTLATIGTAVTVAVSAWLLWDQRDPTRLDHRKVLVQGMCCVVATLGVVYYVGVFSPVIIAMYIGVYFFGLSDSTVSGWLIYASGAVGYLALNLLAMSGVIATDQAVLALARPELTSMIAVTAVCQVLFAATFWMARSSRAATLAAFSRLERASKQIRKRDALLDEARADLDRERAAKLGRFSDQQLGRYALGEVIGRGAMGEVYRAHDTQADRPVAVKFLTAALAGDAASVERFLREAEVASKLRSKHIVALLDTGVAHDQPYLVMELLEGTDLSQQLREKKRLGMSATVDLVTHVAQALSAADEAGIVHRDLKPQNLFYSEKTKLWKVLDFGVSKVMDAASNLTGGAAVGTPSYMSPEQARGEDVDHRADVFSLGVVAYRVLTGRPAFTAPDSATTLYNVVHVQPVRPGELVRAGEDVERTLALALAKDRQRRFSSALMFATALREAARQRLDDRLRRDADELLKAHPWGADALTVGKR